ncbi:ABC transporter ATP-binding protein [Cellulomonas fimi]|uniref:ABC transporter related protein n=1 Tax=Cellulomonas fimi (strain ATCC 484 / DSM 20113 / JCM 1341 / CCUG 24087 / LMG 16345 / NBRC 15513 / NCIMB 8980 / NCTC 7547 / NRS-133) TaxID=590998 RepID=F4H6S5_CELFA|nr:ATP-binding cassette domain-containing protein [Cellulomonas fimi]AEE46836.1 ABC transporter related protein [Cellulomonas fimi ATCC 484]VEH34320.1 Daunorubicin/doxorubicin resistance ATP-binding protein DrrA [Cellulomonas fimi]
MRVRGLRKTYRTFTLRQVVAVDHLDLTVPAGGVHAFLGPNGSGKTTTIRMLLGLARPDAGSVHVFGTPVPERLPDVVGRVGAIVENPKFVPGFSGRRNLRLLATAVGVPHTRVEEVLERVGLRERGVDQFRRYSLGMKQRLAIAATLLKDPDLLVFDEPTNGLDPAGIRDVRATMRGLADEGRTVLVSSHVLAEVEQVADTVSVVARGRLVAEGTVAQLLTGGGPAPVRVGVPDAGPARDLLAAQGWTVRPDGRSLLVQGAPGAARVNEVLARGGVFADELLEVRRDLESVFLELTGTPTSGEGAA